MVKFIARMIEQKAGAGGSLEEGQELYRKYFIYTKIYVANYKAGVDEILVADGYSTVIVKA